MELLQQLWRVITTERESGAAQLNAVGGFLLTLLLTLLLFRRQPSKLKLPPSPFPSLPLLGNVLHLDSIRCTAKLQGLRNKLGSIFTLYVGNIPIIYITSATLAHEALIGKGLLFASRPTFPSRTIFTNNCRSINSAAYGPLWRALRRNFVQEMLAAPKLSTFKPIRSRVLDDMMSNIRAEALGNGGVISVYAQVRDSFVQLLNWMCFGFQVPKDTLLEVCNLVDEVLLLTAGGALTDYYPFLHVFDSKRRQTVHTVRAKQLKVYTALIDKHKEMQKLGQLAPGSYLETLLNNVDASIPLSTDDLVTLCAELMSAGTDTMVATLEWAMARLVDDPCVQQTLYKQIHEVMGDKLVEEEDLQKFPYLQAFIRETLRVHPPVHFTLPHNASELCTVGGYDIPPNAIVMFHVVFMAKDPEIWKEPLKFRPERFLEINVDITGSKEMSMMPFGAGRRICPGLTMAPMHMELVVARLVQMFEWSVWPAASAVDFSERAGFTVRMQNPLKALVKERMGTL